jgi:hypothetical protein
LKCKTYILKSLASPAGGTSPEATSPTTLIIGKVADDPSAKSAIPGTARRTAAQPPSRTPRRDTIIHGSIPDIHLDHDIVRLMRITLT